MPDGPPLIPPFPPPLVNAANDGKLLLFVGAGASRLVGGPSWNTLGNKVWAYLFTHAGIDEDLFKTRLRDDNDPRGKISRSIYEAERLGVTIPFERWLDTDEMKASVKGSIHEELLRLNVNCLTTNFDRCFGRAKDVIDVPYTSTITALHGRPEASKTIKINVIRDIDEGITQYGDQLITGRRPDQADGELRVIHMHGHIDFPQKMVLTDKNYGERYGTTDNSEFLRAIGRAFSEFTVLFVGCGVSENTILDSIYDRSPQGAQKLYSLYPVTQREYATYVGEIDYCVKMKKIQLLPYDVGEKNYAQLVQVIRALRREIGG